MEKKSRIFLKMEEKCYEEVFSSVPNPTASRDFSAQRAVDSASGNHFAAGPVSASPAPPGWSNSALSPLHFGIARRFGPSASSTAGHPHPGLKSSAGVHAFPSPPSSGPWTRRPVFAPIVAVDRASSPRRMTFPGTCDCSCRWQRDGDFQLQRDIYSSSRSARLLSWRCRVPSRSACPGMGKRTPLEASKSRNLFHVHITVKSNNQSINKPNQIHPSIDQSIDGSIETFRMETLSRPVQWLIDWLVWLIFFDISDFCKQDAKMTSNRRDIDPCDLYSLITFVCLVICDGINFIASEINNCPVFWVILHVAASCLGPLIFITVDHQLIDWLTNSA